MDWGLCTTVKATAEQVLAFTAHHLALGAAHLWLYFDDPDDPAQAAVAHLPRVTATPCTSAHWKATAGRRPDKHQNRQSRNMQAVYASTSLPFVGHIDIDEFLWPDRPIAKALAALPEAAPMLRLAPWEALHDPTLPDDIFTARQFRAALKGPQHAAARDTAFGDYAPLLPDGVLSHAAGKCFFRTGLSRFEPRLHGAFRAGVRVPGWPFDPGIKLLHFHAEDRARWLDRLPFRLERGAYQYNPALQAYLATATPAETTAFYARVQSPPPEVRATLSAQGLLTEATLALRTAIAVLKATP